MSSSNNETEDTCYSQDQMKTPVNLPPTQTIYKHLTIGCDTDHN